MKVNLLYKDDLKLMTGTKQQMDQQMLDIVDEFFTDIRMQFGMDECRTLSIKKGKIQQEEFQVRNGDHIESMQEETPYKCLGMQQSQRIDHRLMKEEISTEFKKRVKGVLKTKLDSEHLFKAINTYARNEPASTSDVQDSKSSSQQPTNISINKEIEKPNSNIEVNQLEITSAENTTQGEQDVIREDSKNKIDPEIIKRLDVINELIPKLSSVIETSEKNLKKTFEEVFQSVKVVQERGVSPVQELVVVEKEILEKHDASTTPEDHISQMQSADVPQQTLEKANKSSEAECKENSEKPLIGNLLVNIENIRESKCIMEGFQKELSLIKEDIDECIECNFHHKPEEKSIDSEEKYCDKHGIYIPLIKMKYLCSKSDQIRIFNALKTEMALKKELENQLQKISKLERELSKVKMSKNQEEIKTIESALQFTKSYFNNLLVKQETERLLNEQQKILKQDSAHRCLETKRCDKCNVETQVHEILGKVRESINKDLVEAHQRLKIQKMPDITIKKPLQIQHTLRLSIPPTSPPQECVKNVACETVFQIDKNEKSYSDKEIQTRIMISKTTSIERQPENQSPKYEKNDKAQKKKSSTSKSAIIGQQGQRILKFVNENSCTIERTEKKRKNSNNTCVRPTSETFKSYNPYCCQFLSNREERGESVLEISHKTPSELGFRCTVGTQCDSDTSLYEPRTTQTLKTTDKQAIGVGNSSNYLFGFKEYLRDKFADCSSVLRGSNKVDVVLQVNLDGSNDSDLNSMAKANQGEHQKVKLSSTIPKRKSSHHDKEEEAKTTITAGSGVSEESNINSIQKKRLDSRLKSIPRIPSLKKMFFPPEDVERDTVQTVHVKATSKNLLIENNEVKSKTKTISNTQEEELDTEIETGDVFYKSLIGTNELPERRTVISLDNQSIKVPSPSSSQHTLRTLSTENQYDEQSVVNPVIFDHIADGQEEEDIESIEGKLRGEENVMISPMESSENKGNENLLIENDVEVENNEQDQQEGSPSKRNSNETDETDIDISFISSKDEYNPEKDPKLSYNNYLPLDDDKDESNIDELDNESNDLVASNEETRMLEKIVNKIMDNAEDKITEQYEIVEEPKADTLQRNFNLSDYDFSSDPTKQVKDNAHEDESKKETVLSLFSPNYTLKLNKTSKDLKGNLLEKDFLPDLPFFMKSNKSFQNYKSVHDSLQLSDDTSHIVEKPSRKGEHSKKLETKTLHYIHKLVNDKYDCTERPCKISNSDLCLNQFENEKATLDDSNPKNCLSGLKKITEERLEYAKKCFKLEKSCDSSILSSEGEVKCTFPHKSLGEYHHYPYDKRVRMMKTRPSIQYKNKLSSHIVLENERKHYNHWVTYYSKNKKTENSTLSDSKEKKE